MGVRPGAEIDRRIIDAYTRMPHGGEYDVDEWGRRPVVVLTRDAATPVLKRVTAATITRHIRGLPT
jgi:mRNA-degrading endonuclease toxin of MazEF toxin-antitoxin module